MSDVQMVGLFFGILGVIVLGGGLLFAPSSWERDVSIGHMSSGVGFGCILISIVGLSYHLQEIEAQDQAEPGKKVCVVE